MSCDSCQAIEIGLSPGEGKRGRVRERAYGFLANSRISRFSRQIYSSRAHTLDAVDCIT